MNSINVANDTHIQNSEGINSDKGTDPKLLPVVWITLLFTLFSSISVTAFLIRFSRTTTEFNIFAYALLGIFSIYFFVKMILELIHLRCKK